MSAVLPETDLASMVADAVATAVRAALATPALPRLAYTPAEASAITGLSERWLMDQAAAEQIPSIKVGQSRLFTAAQLLAIVEVHEIQPTSGDKRKALISALAEIKAKAELAA